MAVNVAETRKSSRHAGPGAADYFSLAYFAVNTLLLLHPNRPANWPSLLGLHMIFFVGAPLLIRYQNRSPILEFLRHWYPALVMVLLYSEIQYLNRILTDRFFDGPMIKLELAMFGRQMCVAFREAVPSKIVGEILHFGYFSYYFNMPALFLPLWISGRRDDFRTAMAVVAGTYYFCYLWYIFLPVTGPYWQESIPRAVPDLEGWFFPQLTNSIVAGGSSRGSAFPSSHIGASVAILGMACRYMRPVFRILVVPVTFLTLGTVYGGFHYAVDAIAGLIVGGSAWAFGPRIIRAIEKKS